jgi:hypothetical protein
VQLYTWREAVDVPFDFGVCRADGPPTQDWPFEFCDVHEGGISYRAGVRIGDRVNGHRAYYDPGQSNPRNWKDDTLNELNRSETTTLIVFVKRNTDLDVEAHQHMKKRLEYISTTKVRPLIPMLA